MSRPESAPIRVLMTTDTVGGVWHYSLDLARGLSAFGVETTLAAMGGIPSPEQTAQARAIPGLRLQSSGYKLEWMSDPWEDVKLAGEWLLDLAGSTGPNLVHLNNFVHGTLPWRVPVVMVGHSCVFSWYEHVRQEAPPVDEWALYQSRVSAGLHAATAVTAPTKAMLGSLRKHYGGFKAVAPIFNGCDPKGLMENEKLPLIFAAGRVWDEAKNLAALDAVAAALQWRVCIAGDCMHPDGGEVGLGTAKPLGKLERSEVLSWLGRASIYALPARYEPFGLSVLEAAHAGCALVLGDIPSLREVWDDAALYVHPHRHDALRDALALLIQDRGLREEMGTAARNRAAMYTDERMTEAYVSLYLDLLEKRRSADRTRPHANLHALRPAV